MNFNPHLKPWQAAQPNNVAGKGQIDVPGQVPNIVWQTRATEPVDFENALGDALELAFAAGAETVDAIVSHFNGQPFRTAAGTPWTAALFEAEMARLGA